MHMGSTSAVYGEYAERSLRPEVKGREEMNAHAEVVVAEDAKQELGSGEPERSVQDRSDVEEEPRDDDLQWSHVIDKEASPDWSPSSGPSSEGEGEEERTPSGYILLPQDPEQINGYELREGEAASLEQDSEVSPRMTKWLQKQLNDMTVSTSLSSKTEHSTSDWAKFTDPTPSTGSEEWPNVTLRERTTTGAAMTTKQVEPASTLGEGIYIYVNLPYPTMGVCVCVCHTFSHSPSLS